MPLCDKVNINDIVKYAVMSVHFQPNKNRLDCNMRKLIHSNHAKASNS